MAFSIQGIGTTFIGKRDFRSDGSYLTTEWFVLLFIPILPFRSLRVQETGREGSVFYRKESYRISETTKPQLKQVLYTYGFAVLCGFWAFFMVSFGGFRDRAIEDWPVKGVWLLAFFAPAWIPFFLRRYGRRKARAQPCA